MNHLWIRIGAASVCASVLLAAQPVSVVSPDGKLEMAFTCEGGRVTYTVQADGRRLILASPVGYDGSVQTGMKRRSVEAVWKPVWGKRAEVPERFNEVTLDLTAYQIVARAYDEGVAFRCLGGAGKALTQFVFAGDFTAWYYNGEHHNIGPERLSESDGKRMPPMTVKAADHAYLAVLEADLGNGDPLALRTRQGETVVEIASAPSEAWRVLLFGRTPGAMVDAHMVELLNPPPGEGQDFSWVRPGVAVWDWRANGAQVEGFTYAMSYPSWVRMVDFAAENRIRYLVLDADWYGKEFNPKSDPMKGGYAGDAKKLIRYAKGKGVGIWLYLNDVAGRAYPIEQTLRAYGEWSAAGIKYGFMVGTPQEKNERTRMITALCAKNRLLCNFHDGPVHPYGQMRTWPNAVTRELCHAQLDAHRVFQPKTFVTSVFVNMLAGPIDMNNGLADLTQAHRVDEPSPVPSTLAGEAARTLITFSGATVIPDIPENYRKHPELLRFIAAQQQPWRESVTLSGVIGEHIVMARQAADGVWLVGAATNEDPRVLDVPLAFLGGGRYEALVMEDGEGADFRTHVESCKSVTRMVSRTDTIRVSLAPGGGACLMLTAKE